MGKSRLAPIKTLSIPRLELAAAVFAVRLCRFIKTELDITLNQCYFWTDSMIVLGYIRNSKRRFKTFVANRLAVIHEASTPSDWRHVPTEMNPADLASRVVHPADTSKLTVWHNGPSFLLDDEDKWPPNIIGVTVADDDDEVKPDRAVNAVHVKAHNAVDKLLITFSDWYKLQLAVAWLLRFKDYIRHKYLKDVSAARCGDLTVTEIEGARTAILSFLKTTVYTTDIRTVMTSGRVSRKSPFFKLSPIYNDNLLRVGDRLDYAEVSNDCKHPVLLPSNHHVTELIVRKYHQLNAHMGVCHVLSQVRQHYWIIHGLKTVKNILGRCVDCRRRQRRPEIQQMAPLPSERLTPDKPPFSYVGVDYFGPLYVKVGRSQHKRYRCLFTCLTTRAVHIEISHRIDTDSFLCALQRFISRRGKPMKIFSDNGTNLTSGEKELRESVAQWNQNQIKRNLLQNDIEWHFNPPYASHMGGIWERLIRSVTKAMKSVVKEQLLSDEALQTLACETEKIVNDRPITQVSDDSRDPEPLSPNKLLLMRPNSCIPFGIFDKSDNFCQRWWRQVQYLANLFWRRWSKEYIPALQVRHKWQSKMRNLAVNDLVLVCDEMLPRGKWPLGLVLEVNKGRDGLTRSCRVRMNGSVKVRPITKLCLLEQEVD